MKHPKRLFMFSLAVIIGFGGSIATAMAQSADDRYAVCYRGRTLMLPGYLLVRYIQRGAAIGRCFPRTNGLSASPRPGFSRGR